AYLQAIRVIARGCSSTAHCFQVHSHGAWVFDTLGSTSAKNEYLEDIKKGNSLLSLVGAEKNRPDQYLFSTTAKKVEGGYTLNGEKIYATNAQFSSLFIIFASLEEGTKTEENHVVLLVDTEKS